jgi:hypothetical protein
VAGYELGFVLAAALAATCALFVVLNARRAATRDRSAQPSPQSLA